MRALVKVTITSPANIDEVMNKYPTLRMYLDEYKRASDGGFISEARVIKNLNGTYEFEEKDALDLKLGLLDWGFNEMSVYCGDNAKGEPKFKPGDAKKFYDEFPAGFRWYCTVLCEI